jgi:3-oxoacyl-[acyl-carrier protein] reductase
LSAPDGLHKLAKKVRAIVSDRLDILVAYADASKAATIEDYTVEDFDKLFAVNFRARSRQRGLCLGLRHQSPRRP